MVNLKLQDIPLFQHVPEQHAQIINECATSLKKNSQDVILLEGEPVLGIYVVLAGQVKVHTGHPLQPITLINAGETFGEMSLVEKATASATIRAAEDGTQLILVHGKRLQEKLEVFPDLAAAFYKGAATILSRRLRETTRKVGHELQTRVKINASIQANDRENTLAAQLTALTHKTGSLQESLEESLKKWLKSVSALEQKVGAHSTLKKEIETDVSIQQRELALIHQSLEQVRQTLERVEKHLLAV